MGGLGSGTGFRYGRGGGKPVADKDLLRVDVRFMHRKGWLKGGWRFSLNWSCGDQPAGSMQVETASDDPPRTLWLIYRSRNSRSDTWTDRREVVPIEWQPCNYGGARPWLHCPRCDRRVGVLWGGARFVCRHCNQLAYGSQNDARIDRACSQSQKLRRRLKGCEDLSMPFEYLRRPKGMHRSTFDRITARIARQDEIWGREAVARWGYNPLV